MLRNPPEVTTLRDLIDEAILNYTPTIIDAPRRCGKTTAIVEAALRQKGYVTIVTNGVDNLLNVFEKYVPWSNILYTRTVIDAIIGNISIIRDFHFKEITNMTDRVVFYDETGPRKGYPGIYLGTGINNIINYSLGDFKSYKVINYKEGIYA